MTVQCLHLQKICTNAKYNNIFFSKNDISNGQKGRVESNEEICCLEIIIDLKDKYIYSLLIRVVR